MAWPVGCYGNANGLTSTAPEPRRSTAVKLSLIVSSAYICQPGPSLFCTRRRRSIGWPAGWLCDSAAETGTERSLSLPPSLSRCLLGSRPSMFFCPLHPLLPPPHATTGPVWRPRQPPSAVLPIKRRPVYKLAYVCRDGSSRKEKGRGRRKED